MGAFKALDTVLQELIEQHGAANVAAAVATLAQCRCMRCGKAWRPRGAGTPQQCPACKSVYWQTARPGAAMELIETARDRARGI